MEASRPGFQRLATPSAAPCPRFPPLVSLTRCAPSGSWKRRSWQELPALQARFADPAGLVRELVRRGWLTPYQANQLVAGRGDSLLLGSYVLLDRVGEGGMGQVFKARNWKLGRVVAIKVIRKERLTSDDAVRRFQREIQATAALAHPNIVLAYDADEVGGTHFFVMEYAEGQDLAHFVERNGPLPIPQACDCVRQAALGLQHAFEKGMVHRDIKPHNLLLTRQGVVKIMDLGLASLGEAARDETASTLTAEGVVMGTMDYIAPEQVEDSHGVDIRADLYSLGCTFYFLLTGRVPFPGGKPLEKLYKHRHEQPRPVEQLRPDVPTEVGTVVSKLMAKRPEDRFRTPAEVAAVLAGAPPVARVIPAGGRAPAAAVPVAAEASTETALLGFADLPLAATEERPDSPRRLRQRAERRRLLLLNGVGLLVLGGVVLLPYLLLGRGSPAKEEEGSPAVAGKQELREPRTVLRGHTGPVAALAFSPEGLLASGSEDRTVKLWDPDRGSCLKTLEGHKAAVGVVAFSPDGKALASAGNEPAVIVWDPAAYAVLARIVTEHPTTVRDLAFTLDTVDQFMTVGDDKTLPWWNFSLHKQVGGRYLPFPGWSVAVCTEQHRFAVGLANGTVRLCTHSGGGEFDRAGHRGPVKALAFSPNGKLIASGGADGAVKLWNAVRGDEVAALEGHKGEIRTLSFRPDGRVLASASADGTVRLWDVVSGKETAVLGGPGRDAGSLAFRWPDGKVLATGGEDGTVLLWEVPRGRP